MAGYSQLLICLALLGLTGVKTLSGGALDAFTRSNCTVNGVPVPCGTGAGLGASVFVNAIDLGTTGIDVAAGADALVDSASSITSANASVTVDFFATTAGPVRQGFISYSVTGDGDGSPGYGGGDGSASIVGVASCQGSSGPPGVCLIQHTGVPFLLGVPFEIIATANAFGGNSPVLGGGTGYGEVRVSLFDMSGNPVKIIAPVPEPSHLGITALALMGAAVLFRKRA